jgi:threonine dehydrogenase-like Zn-dependent dehydrogenase
LCASAILERSGLKAGDSVRVTGLISSGLLPAEKLTTHPLPLAEWQRAFQLLEDRQAVKVILLP